ARRSRGRRAAHRHRRGGAGPVLPPLPQRPRGTAGGAGLGARRPRPPVPVADRAIPGARLRIRPDATGHPAMTEVADGTLIGRRSWAALHCFVDWTPADVDAFVVDTLAPTLDRLRHDGRIADRFFVRYADGGPHLRVRVADAAPGVVPWLAAELARAAAAPSRPDVVKAEYVPEVDRYGGPAAIAEAEGVFCRSTDVAVRVLSAARTVRARL